MGLAPETSKKSPQNRIGIVDASVFTNDDNDTLPFWSELQSSLKTHLPWFLSPGMCVECLFEKSKNFRKQPVPGPKL